MQGGGQATTVVTAGLGSRQVSTEHSGRPWRLGAGCGLWLGCTEGTQVVGKRLYSAFITLRGQPEKDTGVFLQLGEITVGNNPSVIFSQLVSVFKGYSSSFFRGWRGRSNWHLPITLHTRPQPYNRPHGDAVIIYRWENWGYRRWNGMLRATRGRGADGAPGLSNPKTLLLVIFQQMFQVIYVFTYRPIMFIFYENQTNLNIPHQRVWTKF